MNRRILYFKENLSRRIKPRLNQVFDDFLLPVNGDSTAAGQIMKVDAMTLARKAQLKAVMDEALTPHPITDPCLDQCVYRALFEHTCAHATFDVFAAVFLKNDRFNAAFVQQMRE
jgi:hypothetical protein